MTERDIVLYIGDTSGGAEEGFTRLQRLTDGVTIQGVSSASDVAQRLEDDDVSGVISEYDLPGQNGVDVLRAVRKEHPDIPFILFDNGGGEGVAGTAISEGVTDYVRKDGASDAYEQLADRLQESLTDYRELQDLRRESNLLDDIFEQAPIHLYVKDEEARYVRQTHHVTNSPQEELGKTFPEISPGEFAERVYEEELEVIETGEPILNKEEKYPEGNNWILRSQVPWRDDDGDIQGLIGVSYHITERKEYEEELKRKNERLEDFASIVSHDLRNPLNVARGRLGLAQAECDSEHLDIIADVFDRMEALIDDLLTLTSQGEIIDELEPVDITEVVKSSWKDVETADATLSVGTSRVVRADRDRFRQLITNLIINAIEHGGPDVTVTVGNITNGFYIEDDGPGIPEQHQREAFNVSYTTSGDSGGFGLSIVKEVAEAHDWDIRVTDGEDGGARFEITGIEFLDW